MKHTVFGGRRLVCLHLFGKAITLSFSMCAVLSCFSHVQFYVTPGTVAHRAPLSMEFSRQEYWSGLPFPSPGELPDLRIKSVSLMSPALAGFFTTNTAWGALFYFTQHSVFRT